MGFAKVENSRLNCDVWQTPNLGFAGSFGRSPAAEANVPAK